MSSHYIFNQAGCIPGVPGTFANVRVDVDDEGVVRVSPLLDVPVDAVASVTMYDHATVTVSGVFALPPSQEDAPTNVAPAPEPEPEPAPVEAPAPEAQPEPASEPMSPPAFENGG